MAGQEGREMLRDAYSLHEWAVLALVALDESERRELLDACDKLTRNPGQRGAEQVIDEAGQGGQWKHENPLSLHQ
jgi:hypothetical protein